MILIRFSTGGPLQSLNYDIYDLAGDIRFIQDNNSTVRNQAFTYELKPTNRLDSAAAGAFGNIFMGYDATDNFTYYTQVGPYTPKPFHSLYKVLYNARVTTMIQDLPSTARSLNYRRPNA